MQTLVYCNLIDTYKKYLYAIVNHFHIFLLHIFRNFTAEQQALRPSFLLKTRIS